MNPLQRTFELHPLLAVKEMSPPLLSKAVVASVSNPRALSKILAALQNRSYHPIIMAQLLLPSTTTTAANREHNENDAPTTTRSNCTLGSSRQLLVERLLKYWGYSILGGDNHHHDDGRPEPPLLSSSPSPVPLSLDHLKMIRKGNASGTSEVLIGIVPSPDRLNIITNDEEEEEVAEIAGMCVCQHIQSVLLLSSSNAKTTATTPLKASIGKKTQRAPVSATELGSVFSGVSLAHVPNFSPIRRDNWNLANSAWPLTTPTPPQTSLQATRAEFVHYCLPPTCTTLATTTKQINNNAKTADQMLALQTLHILQPYADTFFHPEVNYCIAIVCRLDTKEVISAVRMPLIGGRRCTKHSSPMPTPYAVDTQTTASKSTEARHFFLGGGDDMGKEGGGPALYDVDQSSMPQPFFAHSVFEALRIASVRMHDRLTKQRQDSAGSAASTNGGSGVVGGQMEYLCNGLDLITNVEPCTMCAMACVHSRLNRLLFLHRNVGGHGGVSGTTTTPDELVSANINNIGETTTTTSGFRLHCCPSLNHHFNTYEMQFNCHAPVASGGGDISS